MATTHTNGGIECNHESNTISKVNSQKSSSIQVLPAGHNLSCGSITNELYEYMIKNVQVYTGKTNQFTALTTSIKVPKSSAKNSFARISFTAFVQYLLILPKIFLLYSVTQLVSFSISEQVVDVKTQQGS